MQAQQERGSLIVKHWFLPTYLRRTSSGTWPLAYPQMPSTNIWRKGNAVSSKVPTQRAGCCSVVSRAFGEAKLVQSRKGSPDLSEYLRFSKCHSRQQSSLQSRNPHVTIRLCRYRLLVYSRLTFHCSSRYSNTPGQESNTSTERIAVCQPPPLPGQM